VTAIEEHVADLLALTDLPPIKRAARAAELIEQSKAVLALVRSVAIAEARGTASAAEIGRELGISGQAVGKADRVLLREALLILMRDGVSTARADFLAQGLWEDTALDASARRVRQGLQSLRRDTLSPADAAVIEHAARRAAAILRSGD
jgi:hypothetical protein